MKKTLVVVIALLMVAITVLSGCTSAAPANSPSKESEAPAATEAPENPATTEDTSSEAPETIMIGAAFDNLDDPFWLGIKFGMDKAAAELGEKVSISYQVAKGDANTQNKQIQDMVTSGANAIVCTYVDMDAIMQSVKLCNENNIPFIYADRPIIDTADAKGTWGIATDNLALTRAGWEWTAQYAKENGMMLNVLELQGSLTDDNVLKRAQALDEIIAKYPDVVKRVQSVPTEWNLEKCLAGVTNAMAAHPEINCIFMMSDFLIPPTVQALQAADRYAPIGDENHVFLMGYSGSKAAVQSMNDKYMDMCFGMDVIKEGYESVMAAYAYASGGDTSAYTTPVNDPGFVMTQENLAETSKQAYGTNVD